MTPDVSGFDVVAALQQRSETASIPIVVVTAKDVAPGRPSQIEWLRNGDPGKGGLQPRTVYRTRCAGPVPARPYRRPMARVLVIEDNPSNLTLSTFLLRVRGS